ncbi:MAG: CDP-diacylglycerol--serine O-phosphatidyltransferase [Burkholderiaceae bacterium]|nr:CDP-diacylglycerol--serine O-phosphatidyltransferase [Burkholderiaceae bacterium]
MTVGRRIRLRRLRPNASDPATSSGPRKRARGVYLLPNAFTTASLFCGFFAVVQAMNNQFAYAAMATFAAMVLDSLDGRVARLTNTQSAFGEQYDSLSDMVSFGVAPALILYEWSLRGLGKWGWLAAFVYVAGAGLRLARFNANLGVVDKRYFQGLPSPAAAGLVVGFVWVATDYREARLISLSGRDLSVLSWLLTVYAGLTMVSNAPFYSFKDINFRRSVPFIAAFGLVLAFVLVSSDPPMVLFLFFLVYGLSGYAVWFLRRRAGLDLPWSRRSDAAVSPEVPAADADVPPSVSQTDSPVSQGATNPPQAAGPEKPEGSERDRPGA